MPLGMIKKEYVALYSCNSRTCMVVGLGTVNMYDCTCMIYRYCMTEETDQSEIGYSRWPT